MEQAAILELQKAKVAEILTKALGDSGTTVPLIPVPDNFSLSSLEPYMPNLANYRGAYTTPGLKDFCEYNKEFSETGSKCFVNSDRMAATTIFDLGDTVNPLHKEHSATIVLEKTAAYKALLNMNGDTHEQKDIANFIEDWADYISVTGRTGEIMTTAQAAKALRDMTIENARELNSKVEDFGESMSAMERIEAKNKDSLPNFLTFSCKPFNDLKEYQFKVRLSILTAYDKPRISSRIIQLEQLQENMVEEFKGLVEDGLIETEVKVFIGKF